MVRISASRIMILAAALAFFTGAAVSCNTGTTDETADDKDPAEPSEPVQTEVVVNGDYSAGFVSPWLLWTGDGGAAAAVVEGGSLKTAVSAPGSNSWSVQIVQDGIPMPDGKYTVSFRAKASSARSINVQIGNGDSGWAEFKPAYTPALTADWQPYGFTYTKNSPAYATGKIVFELGAVSGGGTVATDVYLDDVSVVFDGEIDGPGDSKIRYPAANADDWTPGTGWTLAWQDEFNDGTFDTGIWTRQTMMDPPNGEWQQYPGGTDATYAWEQDGYMILKAAMTGAAPGDNQYKSARVISNPGGQNGSSGVPGKTFKYGKIAARIQLPYGKGVWPAFWMLGDNINETGGDTTWPECGEIDILEAGSKDFANYGQGTTLGTLHHDPTAANATGDYNNLVLPSAEYTLSGGELFAEKFHVFEIEWDDQSIVWKLDGAQIGEQSISEAGRSEFHEDFYVLFNIAVGGAFTATPDVSTPMPQYMYVDWIRHYSK